MSLVRFRAFYAPHAIALFFAIALQSTSAQQSGSPGSVKSPQGKVANAIVEKTSHPRDVGCVSASFPLSTPPASSVNKYTLASVVAQTWFSTEPVVLPASNFTFSGKAGGKADDYVYPKSNPNPNTGADTFCVYRVTFWVVPYYTTQAVPVEPDSSESENQQSPAPTGGNSQSEDSPVPLTYRNFHKHPLGEAVMVPLRPFLQPNATSISFSDQVGINSTPRWSVGITSNPTWLVKATPTEKSFNDLDPKTSGKFVNYLSARINIDLNNQVNANPNSSVGAFLWNPRYIPNPSIFESGCKKSDIKNVRPIRLEPDITISGAEYDFVSNDVNVYFPSFGVEVPLAVIDKNAVPGVFVWRFQAGEVSGWHVRDPSAGLAGNRSQANQIANEGNQLFRGVASTQMNVLGWGSWLSNFSINSSYQVMVPTTNEPFTVASSSSSKPPTITLTDKARHFVSSTISEKLGNSNFALSIKYQYGSLPPAFWLVKNSLTIGVTLSSGNSRSE
jgi:hypothetical protein